ncbi:hypothetical protein BDV11DRAFT_98507 [Aspergillus similis]
MRLNSIILQSSASQFQAFDFIYSDISPLDYLSFAPRILSASKMPDEREVDEAKIEEATVGVQAVVKSLQQMSSSGRAAQRKRDENHAQKGFHALNEAVEKHLEQEGKGGPQNRSCP